MMTIDLLRTCYACPEQYSAVLDGKQVGYLRLRHGSFTVECPDCGGDLVYSADPMGDGIFNDDERDYFLRFAVAAILKWMTDGPPVKPPAPDVSYLVNGVISQ